MDDSIEVVGFTPVKPEQEICGFCERLNCPTLQLFRTLDDKTPFEWKYVICETTKPNAWNDPNKLNRGTMEGSKCGRCRKVQTFAGVCKRCAEVLKMIYE